MDLDSFKKLKCLEGGHLTELGISVLIDDEAPAGLDTVLRAHVKGCDSCRKQMTQFLRADRIMNPEK